MTERPCLPNIDPGIWGEFARTEKNKDGKRDPPLSRRNGYDAPRDQTYIESLADHGERCEPNRPGQKPETFLAKASEIAPEPIAWLWKYWLARGKLHIIAGAPDGGKTTIYLSFAAIISSGATWPDGTRAKAGNVLIWTSEDGVADTIIPRLTRMGADLDRWRSVGTGLFLIYFRHL